MKYFVIFTLFAPVGKGVPHLFAQLAVGAALHEGLPCGHVKGHLAAVFQLLAVSIGGLEHVLCEAHGERGNLLVELTEALLLLLGHIGAAAHEALVGLFQEAHLLGVQAEAVALLVDGLDTLEEFGIEGYVVAVGGEHGRHLLLDGFHLGAVLALTQVEEHSAHFAEQLAAVLVGKDGVLEGGSLRIAHDGLDFSPLAFDAFAEGGHVVFCLDTAEVGDFVRGAPLG